MMRPPLLSLVLVGISGFCGSPALTITTSVRTLPTPHPASVAAASSIAAATMPNRVKPPPPIHCHHYNAGVTVTELAEGSVAEHVGYLIGLIGIPLVGAILLIAGLHRGPDGARLPHPATPWGPPGTPPPGGGVFVDPGLSQRSRRRRLPPPANPMVPPGYPPPGPYPYGYPPPPPPGIPPNTGYPEQPGPPQPPTYPPYYPAGHPAARPRGSSGTALIA